MSAVIYKNSVGSKMQILPLGTTTAAGSTEATVKVVNLETLGAVRCAVAVVANATLAGAGNTFTIYGSTVAAGTSAFTKIAQVTLPISASGSGNAVVQVDAEDISKAAEDAGLLSEGFKSLVFRADVTSSDTFDSAMVVFPFHEFEGLTPTDTTVLT